MDDIDRIEEAVEKAHHSEEQAESSHELLDVSTQKQSKALGDIGVNDIKVMFDGSKTVEEQTEDVVNAMATASAVKDEKTAKSLTDRKADELKQKAEAKKRTAAASNIEAETQIQKARRNLYEAILVDFGIRKHLPQWMMVIMVLLLAPFYIVKTLIIGVPFGFAEFLMDRLDSLVCRYEDINTTNRPKIRVTIWILLVLGLVVAACLTILKCLNKI